MQGVDKRSFFSAVAVISGTAMGAGYLSIPYSVSKSGFFVGVFYIFLLGIITLIFKLLLGEIILRTTGEHQLAGYAEKYLGKIGKYTMFFALIFGIYSALVAYLIAEGQSLSYVFTGSFSYSILFSLAFWILMSFLSYIGLTALKKYNKLCLIFVTFLLFIICAFFIQKVDFNNFSYISLNLNNLFLPFGVILFSFIGFSAVPEARRVLYNRGKILKKAIIFGLVFPSLFYLIFTFVTLGVFGGDIKEIATFSLGRFFSIIAVLTMFTSFFAQSIAIRDMFRFDFKMGRFYGWLLASVIPMILFILITSFNFISFVDILSIAGIISSGLTVLVISFMIRSARLNGDRKPEYTFQVNKVIWVLILLIFIFGISVAILHYFR